MAEYIMAILRTQLMVVFSWGFNSPKRLPDDKGLKFNVEGFKYQGSVEVVYNDGSDLFEIRLSNGTTVEDVYLDSLVTTIDNIVEKTENYREQIHQEYIIH